MNAPCFERKFGSNPLRFLLCEVLSGFLVMHDGDNERFWKGEPAFQEKHQK